MKLNRREAVLAVATGAVALFGVSIFLARPRIDQLRVLRNTQDEMRQEIEKDKLMAAQGPKWKAEMAELSKRLPVHPAGRKVDVYWLSIMDNLASRHGVNITKRRTGEEKSNGEFYELTIEATEWDGSLDALTHFLFELQNEAAMLDIEQLMIKPREDGLLRGRFSLNCAYTREQNPGSTNGLQTGKQP